MTNEKLNEICSEFAGLEGTTYQMVAPNGNVSPVYSHVVYSVKRAMGPLKEGYQWKPVEFQPVSTDWAAAGRLMDALEAKGWYACWARDHPDEWSCSICTYLGEDNVCVRASSRIMALCLAVAALAAASGKENK